MNPWTRPLHNVRRTAQTVRDFDNGLGILAAMARRDAELHFEVGPLSVTCPNVRGARVPVYEVFAEDAYRLGWFTQGLDARTAALDIGGHIGCFSLALARHMTEARVTTYEASPSTYEYLVRNVGDNDLASRVTPHNLAVWSSPGTLTFADNQGGSGLNGLTAPEGTVAIEVPTVTFADARDTAGPVELVKIDTEGAEYDIVLSGSPADWGDIRRVVMEYHPVDGHSRAELVEFFAAAGLSIVGEAAANDRQGVLWLSRDPLPQN